MTLSTKSKFELKVEELKKEIIDDICNFCTDTVHDDWELFTERYSGNPFLEELDESIEGVQISCQFKFKK